jgi:uncharacterized coiled-coil DUF342 family protein
MQLNSYRNSIDELRNTNNSLQERVERLTKNQEEQVIQLIAKAEEAERFRNEAVEESENAKKAADTIKSELEECEKLKISL